MERHAKASSAGFVLGISCVLAAVVLVAALVAAPAQAATTNLFKYQFVSGNSFPTILAADDEGGTYVASGDVIEKFDAGGAHVAQLDGSATPQGSFLAQGVAIGPADSVFVADSAHNVIDQFDSSGAFVSQFDGATTPQGSFAPRSVAVSSSGDVYVGVAATGVIDKFDASGKYILQFNGGATPQGQIAVGQIAVGSNGDVYVADTNSGLVFRFDANGNYLSELNAFSTPQSSYYAFALAAGPGGDVYIGDSQHSLVVRFDANGNFLSQFDGSGTPQGTFFPFGLAVDGLGGVHVGDIGSGSIDVFSAPVVLSNVSTADASSVTLGGDATLNGSVNPLGVEVAECRFEYGTDAAYGASAPCAEGSGEIGAGSGDVSVHADLSDLPPGVYHFRLIAVNANGTAKGEDRTFAIAGPVSISGEVVEPTVFEAAIRATVFPSNDTTTYRVEYGLTSAYGSSTAPRTVAAGNQPVEVKAHIQGLSPATTYHYRVVAVNGVGRVDGDDHSFVTAPNPEAEVCPNAAIRQAQGSAYLPNCRAYEQVSPVEKGLGFISTIGFEADPTGNGLAYSTDSTMTLAGGESAPRLSRYVSLRSADGWSLHQPDVTVPVQPYAFYSTVAVSEDMTKAFVVSDKALTPGAYEGGGNLYLRDIATGNLTFIGGSPDRDAYTDFAQFGQDDKFLGGAADFSSLAFSTEFAFTPDSTPGITNTYQWSAADGLRLVSVMPGETPAASSSVLRETSEPETRLISDDGSVVAFALAEGPEPGVYARVDGVQTIALSVSQVAGEPETPHPGVARWVSRDGRYAIFSSFDSTPLTADAPPVFGNLYRYNFGDGTLEYLGGATTRVDAVSDDGSHVYFTENGSIYATDGNGVKPVAPVVSNTRNVSTNGLYFAFATTTHLGSYENAGQEEIYLYDFSNGTLSCASCPPNGSPSTGNAALPQSRQEFGNNHIPKAVTDSGEVFFDTPSKLVSSDVNGRRDVYGFRAGSPELISPGSGDFAASFVDASALGHDVFFKTAQSLVSQDRDQQIDIYDARIGGGIAAQNPAPTASCTSEACLEPIPNPPVLARPATTGGGAKASGRRRACPKGRRTVKSHGEVQCTRKKQHKRARNKPRSASGSRESAK